MKRICLCIAASLMFTACDSGKADPKRQQTATTESDNSVQTTDTTNKLFGDFAFVADDQYLILGEADTSWSIGCPSNYFDQGGDYAVVTDLKQSKIPHSLKNVVGSSFRIYAEDGKSKTVTIKSLKLYGRCFPHQGQMAIWEGRDDYEEDESTLSAKEIARQIWQMSAFYVVAEFSPEIDREYLFGVPASKPQPEVYEYLENAASAKAVLKALVKTQNYREAQKSFRSIEGRSGNWWEQEDLEEGVDSYRSRNGSVFTLISQTVGNPCGGDDYLNRFSIWKTEKGKSPQLIYIGDENAFPLAVMDINNDGDPECVMEESFSSRVLWVVSRNGIKMPFKWSIPYLDCPC